jgi:transglutaminase-like putative cysteine protease
VRRTFLAMGLAVLVLIPAWMSLGGGDRPTNKAVLVSIFAAVPVLAFALGRSRLVVGLVTLLTGLLALAVAFGRPLSDVRIGNSERDFFGPVLSSLRRGLLDFFDTKLPFDPAKFPDMVGVVVIAVFAFAVAVGIAIAARRLFLALGLLVLGVGWPATMSFSGLDGNQPLALGGALLAASLGIVVLMRPRTRAPGQAALAGAALVTLAVLGSTSAAVAKGGFVDWNDWDFYDRPDDPVDVRYVWDANYDGISFPEKKTVVMKVKVEGPKRQLYWRATSLDEFEGDRWVESPEPAAGPQPGSEAVDVLAADPLLPEAASERDAWTKQEVRVEALADNRLPGSAQAVRWEGSGGHELALATNGAVFQDDILEQGQRYTVWSWIPRAQPRQLDRAGTAYPAVVDTRYLRVAPVGVAPLPPYGAAGRVERVNQVLAVEQYLQDYRPLWQTAQEVTAGTSSPYEAAFRLESWFRGEQGGFTYDEQPPDAGAVPPLVFFLGSKRGYCQHYAGAMALMLRLLGVPARVAAGFTSGTYDARDKEWTVTDHNAHTWVEVYFPGYGWIPFDPTPDRGELTASYTPFSAAFDVREAAGLTGLADIPEVREQLDRARGLEQREGAAGDPQGGGVPAAVARQGRSVVGVLFVLLLGAAAAIVLAKQVRRASRFATRDPRELAGAIRRDLVGYMLDQGVEVPSSATPKELGRLAERRFGVNAAPFAAALATARYGPPASSRTAVRAARTELRRLRKRLRTQLGAGERIRGALRLRSLTV